ncbi:MAG: glycosyltransferase family 4 protein [Bacteroidetes bacterium]|jgi:glycosyltransferase involved in cell wall biosynthesis|nr:glycosyltransferase family 4 protein [Bacteroidota bacterium]MDF2453088.1 glycosyltransferase family 4 protein [Bacteroidota bacterium]
MRIALITDGISPYVLGGMQKHSFYLAKYFAKNKVHVDLVHYNDSSYDINELEFFTSEEKEFIHSTVLNFPASVKFPGHYIYKSYKYSSLAFDAIKDKLSTYDFIYTKGFSGWKLISEKKKGNIQCCKIGVNFHGYEMFQLAPELKSKLQQILLQSFVKKISQQADTVFSYGGKITDIIKSIGVAPGHIIEIPSGVEKNFINETITATTGDVTKFVFLGRAERRKGVIELNEVLQKLISEKQKFGFEFIGPIPDSLKIKHEFIVYHGEIRDTKKIKVLLSKSDILVCPSWSEGFPNVILEAMASGLAIIATNVGAVSAMVTDRNGWLIEPANKKELEAAIMQALYSKDLAGKKENSLRLVQSEFNWDVISRKTIDAIQKVIN